MQIRSRDLNGQKNRGKSLGKNGNSLQKEGLNLTGAGHVLMITVKELCLSIVEYYIVLEINVT